MVENGKLEELAESAQLYVNTQIELFKLEAIEQSSLIWSELISSIIVGLLGFFFLLFISLSAGFYLSWRLSSNCAGFAIVAGCYALLALVISLVKKQYVEKPIRDKIIDKILSKP